MQVQWWGYNEFVGTLKPNLMQKNLFEFFALTGDRDDKNLDMSTCIMVEFFFKRKATNDENILTFRIIQI